MQVVGLAKPVYAVGDACLGGLHRGGVDLRVSCTPTAESLRGRRPPALAGRSYRRLSARHGR